MPEVPVAFMTTGETKCPPRDKIRSAYALCCTKEPGLKTKVIAEESIIESYRLLRADETVDASGALEEEASEVTETGKSH